jgi:hypothetical protein
MNFYYVPTDAPPFSPKLPSRTEKRLPHGYSAGNCAHVVEIDSAYRIPKRCHQPQGYMQKEKYAVKNKSLV